MTLSRPQTELLTEIRDAGTLYIERYRRYARTCRSLVKLGLVALSDPDYSRLGQDGYSVTVEGEALLQRREKGDTPAEVRQ